MVFQGIGQAEARAAFQPLIDFASASPADYEGQTQFIVAALPARRFWDGGFMKQVPGAAQMDTRPDATPGDYWWSGDGDQVGVFWHAYTSAWLPASLLEPANQSRLVDAWFASSRHWSVAFHFNKGLAGAPPEAIAASRDTPINPEALDAFALAIIADGGPSLFTGAKADPDAARPRRPRARRDEGAAGLRARRRVLRQRDRLLPGRLAARLLGRRTTRASPASSAATTLPASSPSTTASAAKTGAPTGSRRAG